MKTTEEISEELLNLSMSKCDKGLQEFRKENAEIIGDLISKGMFLDLTNIFFKQGFLVGMKAQSTNRTEITNRL